jgi:xanthine dehydrogenase large subunit
VVGVPAAAGKLLAIHTDEAKKIPGVVGIFTAKDLHHNIWGTIKADQPILVEDEIGYRDEPACLIATETREAFLIAKKLLRFDIEEKTPALTIDEAMKRQDILCHPGPFHRGDPDSAIASATHQLSGELFLNGQEHFYMESQASIVYPLENGQLEVHSSSQHPTETQHVCAHAVGIPYHQVVCVVKRMGGGFGGKESQAAHFAAHAALVAHKLKRPARLALTKDDDMMMTGRRHPFKITYSVGFDSEGKIQGLSAKLIADGGAYTDLTPSILDRALFHMDGCYYLPHCHIEGIAVKTNTPSNTAFRGFGGPQGNMAMESIIEDIAIFLKRDSFAVRRANLYEGIDRETTPYGQKLEHNTLPELFDSLYRESDYARRLSEIAKWNKTSIGKVRGLSMTGVKFGIAFTAKFLNQGNALVNIHLDGTIQVSTGATEMGQGVNTKMRQIAAHTFGIPHEWVQVMPTSTEKNHNTSPTAASSGADINGAATLKACEEIKKRLSWIAHLKFTGEVSDDVREYPIYKEGVVDLSHFKFENATVSDTKSGQSIGFVDLLKLAYFNRVQLGEYAFFKTEGLGFNKKTGEGTPFKYFTNGAAVSEVEIDEYTGDLKVLRADILMDLGRPINPGIDQGQVTGGFIQGMGWVTTENLVTAADGRLLSHSPTTYKIPNIQDTPRIFNVRLIDNATNVGNVMRSKAVGEPPLLLGTSVWTAVKNAISYRVNIPHIDSPATPEEILMELTRA